MAKHILFLHGWSGNLTSYGKLPELLQNDGYDVLELHLGKYTSGDDNLSIDDYSIAMENAVKDPTNKLQMPFDIVIHSTGALIIRKWLSDFYRNYPASPVENFIMAAPANNGSLLAGYGKKLPWDWGNKVLYALELGSLYTWNLNWNWLNNQFRVSIPGLKIYHLQGIRNDLDFPNFLDKIDNFFDINIPGFEEKGSDNTVRFCSANLNMKGIKLKTGEVIQPERVQQIENIPIVVFPERSHFGEDHGILAAIKSNTDPVYQNILTILRGNLLTQSEASSFPTYSMLNIRVVDQLGNPVEDFITRFYFGTKSETKLIQVKHRYENDEIDCFYLFSEDFSKVTQFGFRIEQNKINNAVYNKSIPIDLINTAINLNFLESGKTHLVEVMVEKSLTKKAFSFTNPT
jgi:hypothetical protein